ncbi:putative serine/threonine-protein kinase [Cercophora samala]|uniref:non-specific serine/threonine protein kinase n=1 Tax=Cercophora samala TaxID=330535 RepID=A0AA39ZCV6_9PEZI|nr:putative serine/threonine-protein kinase [Cercophora samala]
MDRHSNSRHGRQPLADTTKRVNNTTIASTARSHHRGNDENYVLKSKKVVRGTSSAAVTGTNAQVERQTNGTSNRPAVVERPVPVNHHLSAVSQEVYDSEAARRISQFSNVSSNASTTRQLKTHIGPWQLGKTLGKGTSARVRLARHRVTGQLVAIKILSKSTAFINQSGSLANLDRLECRTPQTNVEGGLRRMPIAIEREIAVLKLIEHPNIIKLLDIWENRSEIYMVTEFVEKGDMFEFIRSIGALNEWEVIFYFRQIMSALDYCHSLNICHRDLKPENILLHSSGQVKIADFGMAALQQSQHHQLTTACGSPHYAAPELLRHQPYKGSAVDIWSMGVILYVMLAGCLPFDDDDLGAMIQKAKRAEYRMPSHLSREAQDLIRRMLVPQPAHRITMAQMWQHPLINKYPDIPQCFEWEQSQQSSLQKRNVSPIPEGEVDIQILRQLKALWHAYPEADLKLKLAQEKPNDQKLFYHLLYNHREVQLENYNNNVPISKSDYHHLKPPNWSKRISTCEFTQPGRYGQKRAVSKFTVISNVPDTADKDDAGTIRSYDPYNASRVFHSVPYASHAKITIHRNGSHGGIGRSPTTVSHSYRSYRSKSSSVRHQFRTPSQRTSTTAGRLRTPRGSMGSIHSHHSTPRVRVSSRLSKRGVDFSAVRKGQKYQGSRHGSLAAPASIAGDNTTYDRDAYSPRKAAKTNRPMVTVSMADVNRKKEEKVFWGDELKQFHTSIARDIDEAFGSSLLVSAPSETLLGSREGSHLSFSLADSSFAQMSQVSLVDPRSFAGTQRDYSRPLPPVPSQSTVSPLSIRKQSVEIAPVTHKVSLLDPGSSLHLPDRRAVSDPIHNRSVKTVNPLPSIYEGSPEAVPAETPARVKNRGLDYLSRAENTIRVVNSPAAVEGGDPAAIPRPLNVRKLSLNPTKTERPAAIQESRRHASYSGHQSTRSVDNTEIDGGAQPKKRVSSWFKRASKDGTSPAVTPTTETFPQPGEEYLDSEASGSRPVSNSLDESVVSRAQKKKAFNMSFWKSNKGGPKMSIGDPEFEDVHIYEDGKTQKKSREKHNSVAGQSVWSESDGGGRKIEVQQNWLARLFRVKPAMRYLCFAIAKRRARQEMVILLRDWRKYGIKDVEVDKERNIIFARVAAKNYLNLKEVAFAVELMTVIEHGKRNQLCIARFTQEKGAASSFHKVVEAINTAFANRALMVTDKRKINMMIKTLNS